jgi:hypothetical protein
MAPDTRPDRGSPARWCPRRSSGGGRSHWDRCPASRGVHGDARDAQGRVAAGIGEVGPVGPVVGGLEQAALRRTGIGDVGIGRIDVDARHLAQDRRRIGARPERGPVAEACRRADEGGGLSSASALAGALSRQVKVAQVERHVRHLPRLARAGVEVVAPVPVPTMEGDLERIFIDRAALLPAGLARLFLAGQALCIFRPQVNVVVRLRRRCWSPLRLRVERRGDPQQADRQEKTFEAPPPRGGEGRSVAVFCAAHGRSPFSR